MSRKPPPNPSRPTAKPSNVGRVFLVGLSLVACVAAGCNDPSTGAPISSKTTTAGEPKKPDVGSVEVTSKPEPHVWPSCQASDQAWIRRTMLALSGRHAWGQAEVNAYEDVLKGLRSAEEKKHAAMKGSESRAKGAELPLEKRLVMWAMMGEAAFRERWSDFVMDALHVVRTEGKSQAGCYGTPSMSSSDDGALAAWVRDHDPSEQNPSAPSFTMAELLGSALALDDLSVVYRAHLFAMMSRPLKGANVEFEAMERSRRQDFGTIFDTTYLHRDIVCLSCHNSAFSVTFHGDPKENRHFPVPGLFELSLYGSSDGKHPSEEEASKGTDAMRAHSVFRVTGVVGGAVLPYGWSMQCGSFAVPETDDPLHIDAYFGPIHSSMEDPLRGLRASVWDVERSLHRGVDKLAAHGLARGGDGSIADPDEAFAYLVAQNIVEQVWHEIMGSRLTIATYFPRSEPQRDILMSLTEHFVAAHFSLRTVIGDILAHPAFNLKAPEEGCGAAAYELPSVFDPWTREDNDPSKRANSPADGVFALSSRPLVRSLHRAMEWPYIDEFPYNTEDASFQIALGFFIKDAEPGYRGLDFQGRLTWESVYAECQNLSGNDFIDKIESQASKVKTATVGDAVLALKDRLVGEPWIEPTHEKPAIEALLGVSMASTDKTNLGLKLRTLCGVLVSTPQFMLGGLPSKDTRAVPTLTPPDVTYDGTCGYLSQYLAWIKAPYTVGCAGGKVVVTPK